MLEIAGNFLCLSKMDIFQRYSFLLPQIRNMQSLSFQLVRRCFSYKMPPNQPDEFVKDAGSREIEFSAILPALQFPQKAEKSCFSCYDNE